MKVTVEFLTASELAAREDPPGHEGHEIRWYPRAWVCVTCGEHDLNYDQQEADLNLILTRLADEKKVEQARCVVCDGLDGNERVVLLPAHLHEGFEEGVSHVHCTRCDATETVSAAVGTTAWCDLMSKKRFLHAHCDGTKCPRL